ncbi:response regulator [Desulfobacterales bacterium HSG16]|nr:response regulator [Desulfobacterales bacterium HSG16]
METKKVLVVDDEMDMRLFLTTLLKISGFLPVTARDGTEGMKKLDEEENLPGLIILDVMMPGEGGVIMYRRLKTEEKFAEIPVIIHSGVKKKAFLHYLKMINAFKEKESFEPYAYIEKPAEPEKLIESIRSAFKK